MFALNMGYLIEAVFVKIISEVLLGVVLLVRQESLELICVQVICDWLSTECIRNIASSSKLITD